MIRFETTDVTGWDAAIRGMRNPMNSWDKSDSKWAYTDWKSDGSVVIDFDEHQYTVGPNDLALMKKLVIAGSDHAKFRRMILVTVDVTAPLYWWKEYDTYKIGTVANSCSTMHKLSEKEFSMDDFSIEHLSPRMKEQFSKTVHYLNLARRGWVELKDKAYWWDMIQMLPSSYNQKRTLLLNYEVLAGIHPSRKAHKLDEWKDFCNWIEGLPLAKDIIIDYGKGAGK